MTKEILAGNKMEKWFVYIIMKRSRLYVGITTDPPHRLSQHRAEALLHIEGPMSQKEAVEREFEIKGWTAQKKRDLITWSSKQ